ncbi:helix-turn-helix transcriptional regulator [Actinomadura sp. DC4]|uniref:helix-turn-helix domain-containing protein n=1 Tax=Actinomadura sp. DC4 TaxID=3055069 RepID=UPI0025B0E6A8|nr:helix-turn-helix transcriptional regulator [Actinomadura sp. DC4]MDN3359297.1 helix-turn-helix transcriptional regulator [Actinomadura sp. DC4]
MPLAPKRETARDLWGKELVFAIKHAGMTGQDLARALPVAPSTVSQWINGKRTPDLKDVRLCDAKLGTNGHLARYYKQWVTREIPSEWDDKWLSAEANANMLLNFELSFIPGLLQTEDYARAIIQDNHSSTDIDERVKRRMSRQTILNDESPPTCIFVIDEYALRRPFGTPQIMAAQLARLCELATRPNIVIKVIPLNTPYYAALPFMIARLDGVELVNVDTTLRGQVIEENSEVAESNKIWEDLREAALSTSESRQLIEKVMRTWEQ